MRIEHEPARSLEAGVLMNHLQGSLDANESAAVAAHLESCAACRAAAAALDVQLTRVRTLLDATDFPPPPDDEWRAMRAAIVRDAQRRRTPVTPWLRVAATITLLAGISAALLATPLLAWIGERLARSEPPAIVEPVVPAARPGAAAVQIPVQGDRVDLSFAALQTSGRLLVRFGADDGATLAIEGGGAEHMAVSRNAFRIANDPASSASYSLALPHAVRTVGVALGTRPVFTLDAAEGTVAVDLANGAVRKFNDRDD